jgi:hypothetical protein
VVLFGEMAVVVVLFQQVTLYLVRIHCVHGRTLLSELSGKVCSTL